jgi:phage terminase small subunit
MALTTKQEKFCQEVVIQPTYSDAYRLAYDCSKSTPESVNVRASELMANSKIVVRVKELKSKLENIVLYTLSESVARDKNLIEKYESCLEVLQSDTSTDKQIDVANRVMRAIGVTGYNSAQDRLSKQHGFYEKDNTQKTPLIKPNKIEFIGQRDEDKQ